MKTYIYPLVLSKLIQILEDYKGKHRKDWVLEHLYVLKDKLHNIDKDK